MKRVLLTLTAGTLFCSLNAQSLHQEDETPYVNYLKYRNGKFYSVDDPDSRGRYRIKGEELRNLLIETDAYESWQLHKTFKGLTYGVGAVAIGLCVAAIINTANSSDAWDLEDSNTITYYALGTVVLAEIPCTILTGVFGRKTAKIYNGYAQKENDRYSLNFGATRNGIGLTFKF